MNHFKLVKIAVIINSLIITAILFIGISTLTDKNRVVYVHSAAVFEKFYMTIEHKKLGLQDYAIKKRYIDSLYVELGRTTDPLVRELFVKKIALEKGRFEESGREYLGEQSSKIWSRIHSYAKEFSDAKGYGVILLNNGKDNILYAEDTRDVTGEFLNYINARYEGIK